MHQTVLKQLYLVVISNSEYSEQPLLPQSSLESFDFFTQKYWIWAGVGFMLGFAMLMTWLCIIFLTFLNPERSKPSIPDAADKEIKDVAKNLQRRLSKASQSTLNLSSSQ